MDALIFFIVVAAAIGIYFYYRRGTVARSDAQNEVGKEDGRWLRDDQIRQASIERPRIVPAKVSYGIDPSRKILPTTFDIAYIDADGQASRRRIDVTAVSQFESKSYLEAWCHLRRAERSFRLDRITEIVSAETGEVVDDPIRRFPALARQIFDPGPDYASVMQKARPGLRALIWIARSDNELSDAEMDLLLDYVRARNLLSGPRRVGESWNAVVVRRWIENERPTLNEAKGGLSRMAATGKEFSLCKEFAERLVTARGSRDPRSDRRKETLGL